MGCSHSDDISQININTEYKKDNQISISRKEKDNNYLELNMHDLNIVEINLEKEQSLATIIERKFDRCNEFHIHMLDKKVIVVQGKLKEVITYIPDIDPVWGCVKQITNMNMMISTEPALEDLRIFKCLDCCTNGYCFISININLFFIQVRKLKMYNKIPSYKEAQNDLISINFSAINRNCLMVSHRWKSQFHPDPDREDYQRLIKMNDDMLLWIDYTCLPDDVGKKMILKNLNTLFQNLPVVFIRHPGDDYRDRAWCVLEYVSARINGFVCKSAIDLTLDEKIDDLLAHPNIISTFKITNNADVIHLEKVINQMKRMLSSERRNWRNLSQLRLGYIETVWGPRNYIPDFLNNQDSPF